MRPHPRIRKTIKWGGAALTVLLVVVWVASGWYWFGWRSTESSWLMFKCGVVEIVYRQRGATAPELAGWEFVRLPSHFLVWKGLWFRSQNFWFAATPFWMLVAPSLLLTALAFRLDTLARRRERMHLCQKCGYDRTGLAADAVCPECGSGSNGGSPA